MDKQTIIDIIDNKSKQTKNFINSKDIKSLEREVLDLTVDYGDIGLSERCYLLVNDIEDKPKCEVCGGDVKYINYYKGYQKCCGTSCAAKVGAMKRKQENYYREQRLDKLRRLTNNVELIEFVNGLDDLFVKSKFHFIATLMNNCDDTDEIMSNINEYYNMDEYQRRSTSLYMYEIRYGSKEGRKKFYNKKRVNPYSVEDIMESRGVSKKEAEQLVRELKEKLIQSSANYYSKTDLSIRKTKKHWCEEYWLNKGFTKEETCCILDEIKNHNLKSSQEALKTKLDSMNEEELKLFNRTQNPVCEEYWLSRGYETEQIEYLIEEHKKKLVGLSKEVWIQKNEASEEEWEQFNKRRMLKRLDTITKEGDGSIRASKESLKVFLPLIEILSQKSIITHNDYYLGYEDKKEYWLAKGTDYYYSYDFTIPKLKIIIEFNGERWHPRKERMTTEEYDNWVGVGTLDMIAEEKERLDLKKLEIARQNGFNVLEIWSSDTEEHNVNKCLDFILGVVNV